MGQQRRCSAERWTGTMDTLRAEGHLIGADGRSMRVRTLRRGHRARTLGWDLGTDDGQGLQRYSEADGRQTGANGVCGALTVLMCGITELQDRGQAGVHGRRLIDVRHKLMDVRLELTDIGLPGYY